MKPQKKLLKYQLRPCIENEVRVSRPKMGLRTDYRGSRTAAIHLFCISCMGGNRADVAGCQSFSCPLWQFRPGRTKTKKPDGIPTEAQYKEMIASKVTPKQREAGKKLKEKRNEHE